MSPNVQRRSSALRAEILARLGCAPATMRRVSNLTPSLRETLISLKETGDPVTVERRITGADSVRGIDVAVGPELLLVQSLDWDTLLNGYAAMRIEDVIGVEVFGSGGPESFAARALRYFKQAPAFPDGVDTGTLKGLLATAATAFHLVTIYTEWSSPDVCYIGQPLGPITDRITLREITPEAVWESTDEPRSWELADITQVEFGGRYEEALYALSTDPRPLPVNTQRTGRARRRLPGPPRR